MADHADEGGNDDVFIYMGRLIPQHLRETITHVRIHKSVKIITERAFEDCANLVSIEMHDGVEIIEGYAFFCCRSLRGIKLTGVRVIEDDAFCECTALTDVEFGDELETIGEFAFTSTALRNVKLPKVRNVGKCAFGDCNQLTTAEFSKYLNRIEREAFCDCIRLRRIAIPLKDMLYYGVFHDCDDLSQVDLVGGIHKTISSLLLDSWRHEMNDDIHQINRDLPNTPADEKTAAIRRWTGRVIRRIEHFKSKHYAFLKEDMTLLELALWKANLNENGGEQISHHCTLLKNDMTLLQLSYWKEKFDKELAVARQKTRVNCGADIVIPHVLSFLNDADEFPLREYNL
jgi:hypothetical protein